jgi:hypothetical protein
MDKFSSSDVGEVNKRKKAAVTSKGKAKAKAKAKSALVGFSHIVFQHAV